MYVCTDLEFVVFRHVFFVFVFGVCFCEIWFCFFVILVSGRGGLGLCVHIALVDPEPWTW